MAKFDVRMSGKIALVTRSFEFPKTDPLPKLPLAMEYTVTLSIAGLDEKSPAAKKILAGFPKAYKKALEIAVQPRNKKNITLWNDAAKSLQKGGDPTKILADTKAKLISNWNEFDNKTAKPLVGEVLDEVVKKELNKLETKQAKVFGVFKSKELKPDRLKVLSGLASVLAGGTATAAAATAAVAIAPLLATAVAVGGTLAATRKLSEKTYSEIDIVRKSLDKELENASNALSKLEPLLKKMQQRQEKLGLLMVKQEGNVKVLASQIEQMKAGDINELDLKRDVGKLRELLKGSQKRLIELRKNRAGIMIDVKSVRSLIAQTKTVSDDFEAKRSTYDKILSLVSQSDTELSAANTVLDRFSKAIKSFT